MKYGDTKDREFSKEDIADIFEKLASGNLAEGMVAASSLRILDYPDLHNSRITYHIPDEVFKEKAKKPISRPNAKYNF